MAQYKRRISHLPNLIPEFDESQLIHERVSFSSPQSFSRLFAGGSWHEKRRALKTKGIQIVSKFLIGYLKTSLEQKSRYSRPLRTRNYKQPCFRNGRHEEFRRIFFQTNSVQPVMTFSILESRFFFKTQALDAEWKSAF